MTPAGRSIGRLLERALRRLRVEAALATALAVAAVVPAALLVGWAVGEAWPARSAAPLAVTALAAVVALVLGIALARRWLASASLERVAAEAERRRGLREGSLRGVVELGRGLPDGVSASLFRRSEAEVAGRLSDATPRELAGDLGDRVHGLRTRLLAVTATLVALAVVAGFAAPERARAGWAPLLRPVTHLKGPALPPITVAPGDGEVRRGGEAGLEIGAPLRDRVRLHWRAVGDVPRSRALAVAGGRAATRLGPVEGALRYWVTAPDGAATDTFTLRPVDPILLRGLVVDVEPPAHVGRPSDHYEGDIPPLRVPEGSRVRVRGSATRALGSAALVRGDGAARRFRVAGDRFELDWRPGPDESGRWEWRLDGAAGSPVADAAPLELTVIPDAPPRVRITSPEAESPMPATRRQGVVADAEDDYGLAAAALVFRRVSGDGRGPEVRAPIALPGRDARLLVRAVLDATGEPLVPGDRVEYRVEVVDNGPAGQVGRSATHVLRVPGGGELRDRARDEAEAARAAAERLAERGRELERETRSLSRRAGGRGRTGAEGTSDGRPSESGRLGFEAAREAEAVLAAQEAQLAEAEALRERLESLRRALEDAGLQDPELTRRLDELQELYRALATPELRAEMEALRRAADALDPEAVERALAELADRQQELRETVEQSLELMRRAAVEQELTTLAREAEEIAAEQRALAEAMRDDARTRGGTPSSDARARADTTAADSVPADSASDAGGGLPSLPVPTPRLPGLDRAEQQEELGERTQSLNRSLAGLQPQLLQLGERESSAQLGAALQQGKSAQQSMQEAASQSRQKQGSKAASSGEQAAGAMADAAATLEGARRGMTEAWRQQAQESVRQATQEALSLAEREEALRQAMEQARQGGAGGNQLQPMRAEQAALQQGLEQLGRNLSETGQRSGLIDPAVGQALARAMRDMEQTLDGLGDARGGLPIQQAGQTVESLNQLAMSLLQNDARLEQGGAESALQQAMRQLADAARQQASLNARAGAMGPMQLGPQALARQLQPLASEQRGIGRRVGEAGEMLGGREDALGALDLLSREAESLARELEGGRLDAEVRGRQERLFQRLLDAGRSLEREEYSDERVGEAASPVTAGEPPALDPALLDPRLRYPPPSAAQLRALPPAYRRLILEYFDRLNGRAPAPAPDGGP